MTDLSHSLPIAEAFFSIQGEGPTMGVPSIFLRFSHCNLRCPAWPCDTTAVWSKVWKWMTPDELIFYFRDQGWLDLLAEGAHLILTGGEPMMWQERWFPFLSLLREETSNRLFVRRRDRVPYIEIETNGTILPVPGIRRYVRQFNVSPKLENSGNPREQRYKPDVLRWFASARRLRPLPIAVDFKFVVDREEDLEEITGDFISPFGIPRSLIWLMPESVDRTELIEKSARVAEWCKKNGFNFSSRLQLIVWDKVTGV